MKRLYLYILGLLTIILTLSSCSSTRKVAKNKATVNKESVHDYHKFLAHLSKDRRKLVEEAETWRGTPYKYAGQDKGKGTDCSGLVMQIYLSALNLPIPRNSAKQAEFCHKIRPEEAKAGDLVFFATGKDPKRVSHVGMILQEDEFIHSSSSKGVVITKLSNPWYSQRLLMYGRVKGVN